MGITFRKKIAMLVSKRVPASQGTIFKMETGDNKVCKNSRGTQRVAPSLTDRSTSIFHQKDDTVVTQSRHGKGKENIVNNGEKKTYCKAHCSTSYPILLVRTTYLESS